jgi:hypothetical protein
MAYRMVDVATVSQAPGPHPAANAYDKGAGRRSAYRHLAWIKFELPPRAETIRHDHVDDGAEDAYAVIGDEGIVFVGGESVPVKPGQFNFADVLGVQCAAMPRGLDGRAADRPIGACLACTVENMARRLIGAPEPETPRLQREWEFRPAGFAR